MESQWKFQKSNKTISFLVADHALDGQFSYIHVQLIAKYLYGGLKNNYIHSGAKKLRRKLESSYAASKAWIQIHTPLFQYAFQLSRTKKALSDGSSQ